MSPVARDGFSVVGSSEQAGARRPLVRTPRRLAAAKPGEPENAVAGSGVGFVLFDASLNVLYANSEAVRILAYPAVRPPRARFDDYVAKKIQGQLKSRRPSVGRSTLTELSSGRRRYLCRAFALGADSYSPFMPASFQPNIAAVIERDRARDRVAQVGDEFHLTSREREAMGLLLQGLTSKEIAERMHVSPNTVKAFLRLIMLRMRVSTRSGIIGKILAGGF
jgi:DNA-binding CsgD family transcriptional regulator